MPHSVVGMEEPLPRPVAEAIQVGHALDMVAELPPLTADERLPIAARVACAEAFFSNLRVLVEFLVLPPSSGRIHRHEYLPGWDPEDGQETVELRRLYGLASENVSHLMKKRVPHDGEVVQYVGTADLERAGTLANALVERFTDALRHEHRDDYALLFSGFVMSAEARVSAR